MNAKLAIRYKLLKFLASDLCREEKKIPQHSLNYVFDCDWG